jgi:uncharacterized protein
MNIFIDTSAFIAILNADDSNHKKAKHSWIEVVSQDSILVCSNYILLETYALLQHRIGIEAVRVFHENILPVLAIEWVTEEHHEEGIKALLIANERNLSLVDCISFNMMRRLGIKTAFAFDKHFKSQGFRCIPM